ncbi:MAG: glycosyltransferase family 1 protein [Pseudomonadota bacterium]
MKILFVTDAWRPQINGVVRTLEELIRELQAFGFEIETITPDQFMTVPTPGYPEIRLALVLSGMLRRRIEEVNPDHIHIATEGPLGTAARSACLRTRRTFTSSYHTRFPEYLRARVPIPLAWTYAWLRRFHNSGTACLVATRSIADDLESRGFNNVVPWTRGVDHDLFKPRKQSELGIGLDWKRPVFVNVGRVSVEKNLEAFLSLDLPGTKLIVGDGPARNMLEKKYPEAIFAGAKSGLELAKYYNAADVFVFPSLTDTFGNVLLEALASGLPVAAFPVPGPLDVIGDSDAGILDNDLKKAAVAALDIPSKAAVKYASKFTWNECARIFLQSAKIPAYSDEPSGSLVSSSEN